MSTHPGTASRASGFTLVEVMVALIVICVGLLGIASMQGLAVSSTNGARQRSLAAIEAASLAASMHSNRVFWTGNGTTTVTVTGTTVAVSGGSGGLAAAVTAAKSCVGSSSSTTALCTPDQVAGFDVNNWATAVSNLLPSPTSTITCGTTTPLSCTIDIKWVENAVAANKQEAAAASGASSPAGFETTEYVLYVEP